MSLFTIDPEKCKRDGICVAECPAMLIELKDDGTTPAPVEDAEQRCIGCGHCVCVCPHGALTHSLMAPGDCPPYRLELALDAGHVEYFLRCRRSIRTYKDTPVKRDTLSRLIKVARYAPTGTNSQQLQWLVIATRPEVAALTAHAVDWMRFLVEQGNPVAEKYYMQGIVDAWDAGIDIISRGAPALVIPFAPEDYQGGNVDATIALAYLDLAAPSFGLGSCWAGFFMIAASSWPKLKEALNIPPGHVQCGAMMVGTPKYRYHRLPPRNEPEITWQG